MNIKPTMLQRTLRTQGYAVLPDILPVAALEDIDSATRTMIDQWYAGARHDPDFWACTIAPTAEPVLYRIHHLDQGKDPSVARLLAAAPLQRVVQAVYNGPGYLTACALILKTPFHALPVPWHRDRLSVPPCSVYNFSLYLDDASPANGCLEVLPQSHGLPSTYEVVPERPEGSVFAAVPKGGVVIHDVRIVHGSGGNPTAVERRSIVMEYCPAWIQALMAQGQLRLA